MKTTKLIIPAFIAALSIVGVQAEAENVFEFEVAGMSCDSCAATATRALREINGVLDAEVTFQTKRASVTATERVTKEQLSSALAQYGFEIRFDNSVPARLTEEEKRGLDIAVAAKGIRVDLEQLLAKGKFTIVDFWAEWCGPCHLLTPKLERLVQKSDGAIALRTVDLVSWSSELAKQATDEFRMPGLPYVRVYGPDGLLLGVVTGNHIEKIEMLIEEGGER